MKTVLIISILSFGVLFTSCEKDNNSILSFGILSTSFEKDNYCFAPYVEGTYTGTKECDESNPVNVTFKVFAGDNDNQIIVDGITTFIDDCDIYGSTIVSGTGREIDGDIDGNNISFLETIKVNGKVEDRCIWKSVKK